MLTTGTRRGLVLAAIAVVALAAFAPDAAAQSRRRASRSAAPGGSQPGGDCHTFGLVRAGLVASYLAVAPGGNANFTITYISDTPTQTRTTQKTTTAQGTADAETILTGEVVGNLRTLKHITIKVTTVVPVLGPTSIDTDIDYVPSLVMGPAEGWCVGAKWTVSPSTQTLIVRSPAGPITNVTQTQGSEGEVLAVGEQITVPGGTFNTVKYRGVLVTNNQVQSAITWVSMEHNIVVKQDTIDTAGNVTSVTELQRM